MKQQSWRGYQLEQQEGDDEITVRGPLGNAIGWVSRSATERGQWVAMIKDDVEEVIGQFGERHYAVNAIIARKG
jgi:hypothetical protein